MFNFKMLVFPAIFLISINANASYTDAWRLQTQASSGPLLQVDMPNSNGKKRAVFIAFEYERQCDPIFSYAELYKGNSFGTPLSRKVLKGSKIGIILNGHFYTSDSGIIKYDNGYEAAFAIPNNLVLNLLVNMDSLSYVSPTGEVMPLPKENFQQGFLKAIDVCKSRIKR